MYANLRQKHTQINFKAYKVHRNILNRAKQAAKQSYYQNIILFYKNSSDKLWKALDEIIMVPTKQNV